MTALWGGRFEKGLDDVAIALSFSLDIDKRLFSYDILTNQAHAKGLHKAGYLSDDDLQTLLSALDEVRVQLSEPGAFDGFTDEDIHSCVERLVTERCGDLGKKLHTGKSRNDQVLTDVYHKDLRRARSATQSMIPTKTGAAAAVGLVLPELNGKLDGFSVRVPTINVSLVDLTFRAARDTTIDEINSIIKSASEGDLKGVLAYNDGPLVSIDFNHDPASSTYDATLTKVMGGSLVKVCSWYDNEWGFSNRMLDTTLAMMAAK